MDAGRIERIETTVERGAFVVLGVAIGAAALAMLDGVVAKPLLYAVAAGAGLFASVICSRLFAAMARRRPQFTVPVFDVRDFEPFELDELVLTEQDRAGSEPIELVLSEDDRVETAAVEEQPLLLDDILAEMGPDSRVVRLFDRASMPTPGQLRSRIDDHLGQTGSPAASDASQALSDALAELRRSLR